MDFANLYRAQRLAARAEAALRELTTAESITAAESLVSRSREDALIAELQTANQHVVRAQEMLAQANLDGDTELISLVQRHLGRKTADYRTVYNAVRAE
ncbi:hypothetical protein [Nocardia sp. alder85J]|uniref:hypothetical protein n=1 Tax=Nocardia sp. alder85J TaxID=2862949 RepID=UPI001CD7926C|nr:hypothetical protein [Nocardia sp. alder85J]MCX4094511.1 hypothetical protein [Nocardia sp. alder85J]